MAQYTPKGWRASASARLKFAEMHAEVLKLVQQRARKFFAMSAISNADLIQEGLIAALYAIDSYKPERGKLAGYINTVVTNAMKMILTESRSQCRQPYTWVKADDSPDAETQWRRVPAFEAVEPDTIEATETFIVSEKREELLARQARHSAELARLSSIRKSLSPIAAKVFDLRCQPPVELLIIARNLVGRTVTDRVRMPNQAIALYLNVDTGEVARAVKEVRTLMDLKYPDKAVFGRSRSNRNDSVLSGRHGLDVHQEGVVRSEVGAMPSPELPRDAARLRRD